MATIKDSFLKNPLPYILLVGGGVFLLTRGIKAAGGLINKGLENKFETGNIDNPFSYRAFFAAVPKGKKYQVLTVGSANALAKIIYDAFGFFYDNENEAKDAFRKLKTKSQVAFLAQTFSNIYKKDLLDYLKNGYGPSPAAGLSTDDYNEILKLVDKLPKY